jgi:hypothetical protein
MKKLFVSIIIIIGSIISCKNPKDEEKNDFLFVNKESIENKISTNEFLRNWNDATMKIFNSKNCNGKRYVPRFFIDSIRVKEIEMIEKYLGINDIKYINESVMFPSISDIKFRILDKNNNLHSFQYNRKTSSFFHIGISKSRFKTLINFNDCITSREDYQYAYIESIIENGKVTNVNLVYD